MTWIPIWTITSQKMIFPSVITFLSSGVCAYTVYGNHRKEVLKKSQKDVISPDYNPFLFRKN